MRSSTHTDRLDRGLRRRAIVAGAFALFAAAAAIACASEDTGTNPTAVSAASLAHGADARHTPASGGLDARTLKALANLRRATAPFHRLEAAIDAGYDARVTECLSDPVQGGMGFHYADLSRFDATVEAMRPELLVYAPDRRGALHLVAVEYAVPLTAWTNPEPPSLFGRPFHVNPTFGLWVLHAWVWKPNPAGMFADFNPRVQC